MGRFQFRLQRYLDLKAGRSRALQQEMAGLRRELASVQAETERIERLRRQAQQTLLAAVAGVPAEAAAGAARTVGGTGTAGASGAAEVLQLSFRHTEVLHLRLQVLRSQRKRLQAAIEELRIQLLAAQREVKALSRLRERRWQEYRRQRLAEEQSLLDEMGTGLAHRRRFEPLGGLPGLAGMRAAAPDGAGEDRTGRS